MLGMAFVAGQKQHISLTLFLDKVSPMILGWWEYRPAGHFYRVFHLGVDYRRLKNLCYFYAANLACAGHSDGGNFITRFPARAY
ncbi:trap dicarboxylate transporter, dctq subunit [Salmonella enterica subsp. arizonae]|uniref:Trap dicarboxylate transporter, dctq subunit n=1 Tax=Salmonella enterica subsp. arizonae TaxID=59203 RepID=A0A379TLD4_SALER|nr:trap dicarboxylate transporter, dctq subunit [Salmonella enterica subsp. arizonae]